MASTGGRVRIAVKGSTIYDSYPLSLRTFLASPSPRAVPHPVEDPTMNGDDDDFLCNLHNTSSSVDSALARNAGMMVPFLSFFLVCREFVEQLAHFLCFSLRVPMAEGTRYP